MIRKRSFRPHVKKNYLWIGGAVDGFINVAAGINAPQTLITITDGTEDVTLVRCRGLVTFSANDAGYTQYWGAVGIIRVTDREFAGGAGVVPGPWTNLDYDWLWHSYYAFTQNGTLEHHDFSVVVDAKAKRRLDDNDRLALVVENQSANTISFNYGVRCLFDMGRR